MEIYKEAIVPYRAECMFRLVDDIPAYPQFLPWCREAQEHERCDQYVVASLSIARFGIKKCFTTKNMLMPPSRIVLSLVEGPFRLLQGEWHFESLGEQGSKITLHLRYDTQGRWFDHGFARVFDHIANSLVEAFCERAKALYGN